MFMPKFIRAVTFIKIHIYFWPFSPPVRCSVLKISINFFSSRMETRIISRYATLPSSKTFHWFKSMHSLSIFRKSMIAPKFRFFSTAFWHGNDRISQLEFKHYAIPLKSFLWNEFLFLGTLIISGVCKISTSRDWPIEENVMLKPWLPNLSFFGSWETMTNRRTYFFSTAYSYQWGSEIFSLTLTIQFPFLRERDKGCERNFMYAMTGSRSSRVLARLVWFL